jgi:holin-like protein
MLYLPLIAEEWLAISVALVASTLLTIALTALLMAWLVRITDSGEDAEDDSRGVEGP